MYFQKYKEIVAHCFQDFNIPDFVGIDISKKMIRKHIKFSSDSIHEAEKVIQEFKSTAFKICPIPLDHELSEKIKSYVGDINLSIEGEIWPRCADGTYLSPIIQLHIPELKKVPDILKDLDYLMIFLHPDGYYYDSSEDHISIRTYTRDLS